MVQAACVLALLPMYVLPPPRSRTEPDPLIKAVSAGDAGEVQSLLSRGHDPNARQNHMSVRWLFRRYPVDLSAGTGKTALILAVELGHTAITKMLLDAGADVNLTSASGDTALTCALAADSDMRTQT